MIHPAPTSVPSLQINLDVSAEGREEAVFHVVRFGHVTELIRCRTADLGLRPNPGERQLLEESAFGLPPRVAAALEKAFLKALPYDRPLWIDFPAPRGYLHLVPWERLLSLPNPVLRAPLHRLRPARAPGPFVVAVIACAAYPEAADGVTEATAAIVHRYESLPQPPSVLVFGTPAVVRGVSDRVGGPMGFPLPKTAPRAKDDTLTDAYLRSVRTAMNGRSVDCVHFVGDAYQAGARGSVAVPTLPAPARKASKDSALRNHVMAATSRLVDTPEFGRFLTQIGAWSSIATTPRGGASATALRAFAAEIAEHRPGIAMVHEFARDRDCHQLGIGFDRLVAAGDDGVKPDQWFAPMPAIACWGAPRPTAPSVGPPGWADAPDLKPDSTAAFIGEAARRASRTQWVASAIRSLENQQVTWLPDGYGPADPAAFNALRAIGALVERYALIEPDAFPDGGNR